MLCTNSDYLGSLQPKQSEPEKLAQIKEALASLVFPEHFDVDTILQALQENKDVEITFKKGRIAWQVKTTAFESLLGKPRSDGSLTIRPLDNEAKAEILAQEIFAENLNLLAWQKDLVTHEIEKWLDTGAPSDQAKKIGGHYLQDIVTQNHI